MFHVTVGCPFSLLCSVPWCAHATIYLSIVLSKGIWEDSSLELSQIVLKQPVGNIVNNRFRKKQKMLKNSEKEKNGALIPLFNKYLFII